jgi:hypothetical protein
MLPHVKAQSLSRKQILLVLALLAFVSVACGFDIPRIATNELRTENHTVERQNATSLQAQFEMGMGELHINSGAEALSEMQFQYNVDDWQPILDSGVNDGQALISVRQPQAQQTGLPEDNLVYRWDVALNNEVPTDLTVNMGVGGGQLLLEDLTLTRLELNTGAGGAEIRLGDSSPEAVLVRAGVGGFSLNLGQGWRNDADITIETGVGGAEIFYPAEVGIRVQAETGLGGLEAPGFTAEGNVYTNDTYGSSDITLNLTINGGVGGVSLTPIE